MGGLGNHFLPYRGVCFMVYKFLQTFPLSVKSLAFQLFYGLVLFVLVSFLGLSRLAFLAGFLFAHVYMLMFFYSAILFFKQKRPALGMILMLGKWILLLSVLLFVSWFLDSKAFLIGLSSLLSLLICYVFENMKKI